MYTVYCILYAVYCILHTIDTYTIDPEGTKAKLTVEQVTKTRGGVKVSLYSFFNLDARWGGWSTSRPGRFTPRKRPGTHCTGGWVGPRAGVDRC